MNYSNVLTSLGLLTVISGSFLAIKGIVKQKSMDLYSSALAPGFINTDNIRFAFKQKNSQFEGFILILVGSFFQLLPTLIIFNQKIIFNKYICVIGEILFVVLASFIFDTIMMRKSSKDYNKEDKRRKNLEQK